METLTEKKKKVFLYARKKQHKVKKFVDKSAPLWYDI